MKPPTKKASSEKPQAKKPQAKKPPTKKPPTKKPPTKKPQAERLQKVLAYAGVASRRASEAIIQAGRVSVNGKIVTELGTKVKPGSDVIKVDGKPLPRKAEKLVYIILHKPRHVLSAASDDRGRKTVLDLLNIEERVYPVGRLDLLSEGLILLTNDGELTQKLTHPSRRVEKEYQVLVAGNPSTETINLWRNGGIELEGKPVAPAKVERMKQEGEHTWLKVVLTEGRKRQIREVAKILNHRVKALKRVRIGPIRLGSLKSGRWRQLNRGEIARLKRAVN